MESKSSVTTAVITLVIGLLVGGGVGYAVSSMNMDDSSLNYDNSLTSGRYKLDVQALSGSITVVL